MVQKNEQNCIRITRNMLFIQLDKNLSFYHILSIGKNYSSGGPKLNYNIFYRLGQGIKLSLLLLNNPKNIFLCIQLHLSFQGLPIILFINPQCFCNSPATTNALNIANIHIMFFTTTLSYRP